MRFSTDISCVIPCLNSLPVGNVKTIIVGRDDWMHSYFVSAMELALMGGCPAKDEQAGSEAFEFIRKGSGRKPGAAEAIFFARKSKIVEYSGMRYLSPANSYSIYSNSVARYGRNRS